MAARVLETGHGAPRRVSRCGRIRTSVMLPGRARIVQRTVLVDSPRRATRRKRLALRSRTSLIASRAASTCCSTRRASASRAVPASVRDTVRLVRFKSRTPSSVSSLRLCSLTVGWATCSRSAARLKCSSYATATKYLRCRSSTVLVSVAFVERPPRERRAHARGQLGVAGRRGWTVNPSCPRTLTAPVLPPSKSPEASR
jgi:hypothetical protein